MTIGNEPILFIAAHLSTYQPSKILTDAMNAVPGFAKVYEAGRHQLCCGLLIQEHMNADVFHIQQLMRERQRDLGGN